MKLYKCSVCESKNRNYSGTRKMVRKHLKEYHLLPVKMKDAKGEHLQSSLSKNTIGIEI